MIGAGVSGLLAARALSDSFTEVVIVDRDILPDEPLARRGVPQGRHGHVLLSSGLAAIEELLPGFSASLAESGIMMADMQESGRWYIHGQPLSIGRSGLVSAAVSRPALEHAIRTRVLATPNITLIPGCQADGLIATTDLRRITAVRLLPSAQVVIESPLPADLVVDATGRGTRTHVWFEQLGLQRAHEEIAALDVRYLTKHYYVEPGTFSDLFCVMKSPSPPAPRGGAVVRQEGGRFCVSLSAVGQEIPDDDQGVLAYAEGLDVPEIADLIRKAEPVAGAQRMRYPASIRRHYEHVPQLPDGYVVVGDALCTLNPVFAQGMSVAAFEARLLRRLVADGLPGLARRYFQQSARLIDAPWLTSTRTVLAFSQAQGRRTLANRTFGRYLVRLQKAASTDATLAKALLRVNNLVDPPAALFSPHVLWRVLRGRRAV